MSADDASERPCARDADPLRCGARRATTSPAVAAATQLCDRPRRGRPGLQARHRRLRLLDVSAQRHRDVLLLLRGACGAADGDRRRPVGAGLVRSDRVAIETGLPAALELHLRPVRGGDRGRAARSGPRSRSLVTGLLGLGFLMLEAQRFRRAWCAGRRAAAQRLPVVVLRRGRLPRPARHAPGCCGSAP